jgi:hypothetical protein
MSYLYGDSTPSSLEINFVEFLGDCLDFCAQLLVSTDRMQREGEHGDSLRRAADADMARLEKLAAAVSMAVSDCSSGDADDPTVRCAAAIVRAASDLAKSEIESVSTALKHELARLDAIATDERARCAKALETLLMRHDLPQSTKRLTLQSQANGPYAARLRSTTPFGVQTTVELGVPSSHLYSHVVRVDRLVDRLEVQAPDIGGWLHKEVKMRPQRLDKLHVIHLDLDAEESSMKLRASADGSGPGFDVIVRETAPQVSLMRRGDRDGAPETPFDVLEPDAAALLQLFEKLRTPARELAGHRKALADARLDDQPLRDHQGPSVLVERLVAIIAPITQEISRRSPSATELVLKRLVSGGRREEIFVTKAELREKLDRVPLAMRSVFHPLGLGTENGAHTASAVEPATLVMARRGSASTPSAKSDAPTGSVSNNAVESNPPPAFELPPRD